MGVYAVVASTSLAARQGDLASAGAKVTAAVAAVAARNRLDLKRN